MDYIDCPIAISSLFSAKQIKTQNQHNKNQADNKEITFKLHPNYHSHSHPKQNKSAYFLHIKLPKYKLIISICRKQNKMLFLLLQSKSVYQPPVIAEKHPW